MLAFNKKKMLYVYYLKHINHFSFSTESNKDFVLIQDGVPQAPPDRHLIKLVAFRDLEF